MLGRAEPAHIQADLGDDRLRSPWADAWDLIEAFDDVWCAAGHCGGIPRDQILVAGVRIAAGVSIGIDARTRPGAGVGVIDGPSRVGQLGDQLLDAHVRVSIWAESASIWPSSIRANSA